MLCVLKIEKLKFFEMIFVIIDILVEVNFYVKGLYLKVYCLRLLKV